MEKTQGESRWFLAMSVAIASVVLLGFSSLRHGLFQSTALDLAVFDQWVYLLSRGLPPISSLLGFHVLGDHAAFMLYPLSLLYRLNANVHWLLALQAIALALGAIPIYFLSRSQNIAVPYARTLTACYLLYPALFNSNFYTDFRPEAIAVPALLWAVYAGTIGNRWQLALALGITLCCKETLALTAIALGIWLWLAQKRRVEGLGCILVGVGWWIWTVGFLIPPLRGGSIGGVAFYSSLGGSLREVLQTAIANPGAILVRLVLPDRLFYYLLLVLPVGLGLRWQRAIALLPAVPMLVANSLSDYAPQRDLIHHYALPIFPFLLVWLVLSVADLPQHPRSWLTPTRLLLWSVALFFALGKYGYFTTRYTTNLPRLSSLRTAVQQVTTADPLLTTDALAPHLSHRPVLHLVREESEIPTVNLDAYRYVAGDRFPALQERLQQHPGFAAIYQRDGAYVFQQQPQRQPSGNIR